MREVQKSQQRIYSSPACAEPGLGCGIRGPGGKLQPRNFVPLTHLQRAALTLNNGTLYVAFGSHGDHNVYQGWVMGYDASNLTQKFVWSTTDPTSGNNEGAIWQSGGGIAVDSSDDLYVETGNGVFDVDSGGSNYSDSVVKLSPNGTVLDYFTPFNQSLLATDDIDSGLVRPDGAA